MPDENAKKQHKKKVLGRWENEGGSLPPQQTKPTENAPTDEPANQSDDSPAKDDPPNEKRSNR